MRKTLLLAMLLVAVSYAGEKSQVKVIQNGDFYDLSGHLTAFGKYADILLPGVTVHLFREDRLIDSTRLDSTGAFMFRKLPEGEYDLAILGNLYFPKKICQIKVDSTQKNYPGPELQNLEEKYPDSTWRPGRYLYVTYKSELTEDEIVSRLIIDYGLKILPFNNNSQLQPMLRADGTKFYRATILLSDPSEGFDLANKLVLDPYVYDVEPDLLLPLPPAIKTNQKPRGGR